MIYTQQFVLFGRCCFSESVRGPTSGIPTYGDVEIDIRGSFLGISDSAVQMVYSGGSDGRTRRTLISSSCFVIEPNVRVVCLAVPGVGANYSVQLIVDGGVSNNSSDMLSYSAPTVNQLFGNGSANGYTFVRSQLFSFYHSSDV